MNKKHDLLYFLILSALVVCGLAAYLSGIMFLKSITFWLVWILLLLVSGKKTAVFSLKLNEIKGNKKFIIPLFVGLISVLTLYVMSLNPLRDLSRSGHRDQYERTADAFLDGHLYLDYDDIDPRLLDMDNPYDPDAREAEQIVVHWDHAFYGGRYYMYFGVVPVILLFLPFRLITGHSLPSVYATQIFSVLFIIAFFLLAYNIARKFFKNTSVSLYLFTVSSLALVALNSCIEDPVLYNTAVSSAICMATWSLYFYFKAVYLSDDAGRAGLYVLLGALLGAFSFGCRPGIGLYNIVAIPVLISIVGRYKDNRKKLTSVICKMVIPYLIVGVLLMIYNYVRFDSVFEFGQSYQLTIADQHMYGNILEGFDPVKIINCLIYEYIMFNGISETFPYVSYGGLLVTFPIMWMLVPLMIKRKSFRGGIDKTLSLAGIALSVSVLLNILISIFWTPYPLVDRYKGDLYFAIGLILAFYIFAYAEETGDKYVFINRLSVLTFFMVFLLYFAGESMYEYFNPDIISYFTNVITFSS